MDKNTKEIKVSIIVPVYNVKPYLSRCVTSLLSQTIQDFEIILVDDGSNDGGEKLCDKFKKQYPETIAVVHQKNSGLCEARRAGMRIARGKYIGFVDSDDWADKDMFLKLFEEAEKTQADVTICDCYKCGDGMLAFLKGFRGEDKISVEEFYRTYSPGFMCNKLYKRELISKMMNEHNGVQAEDLCVNLPLFCQLEKLAYVEEPLYYYYQRATASSNADGFSKRHCLKDHLSALEFIVDSTKHFSEEKRDLICDYVLECICNWALQNPARECYIADYVEFLNKVLPYMKGLPCVEKRENLKQWATISTMPKKVYRFENKKTDDIQKLCDESVEFYAREEEKLTIPNVDKTDVASLPKVVQEAYKNKDYGFVKDYVAVKTIYENGGIFIGENIRLNLPLGGLRANKAFFAFKGQESINDKIFGGCAKSEVFKDILNTYEEDSFVNTLETSLERRILFVIMGNYNVKECIGQEQRIVKDEKDYGVAYDFSKCSYHIDKYSVAEIYTALQYEAEKQGCLVLSKDVLVGIDEKSKELEARVRRFRQKARKSEENLKLVKESLSWKLSSPIRFAGRVLRKIFKRKN